MQRPHRPLPRALGLIVIPLVVVVGIALVAVAVWGMYDAFQEAPAVLAATPAPSPTIGLHEVSDAFERGLAAVRSGDRAAFRAALPARGVKANAALDDIWDHLAPLEWGALTPRVVEVPGKKGAFDVTIAGAVGGAGPVDRILVDRVLVFESEGGRPVATGDRSPALLKRQYFSAFLRPRMLKGSGVVVVYESGWKQVARQLADYVPGARRTVDDVLGEHIDQPIVVFVYSSTQQVVDYLGNPDFERRVRFFSRLPKTLADLPHAPSDIGVVATELDEVDAQAVLTHEVTHTLTSRWFFRTRNDPTLLQEGMAVAVANGRSFVPLKNDLLDGELTLPLLDTFATESFWQDRDMDRVELAYLESGATVQYILSRWGSERFRSFAHSVAESSLSREDIKTAVRDELDVSWAEFYEGWAGYVQTLP